MSIFENEEIRHRLTEAFPEFYVNRKYEIIIYPRMNSYFLLADVETELDLKAKILEWLSREAAKSIDPRSMKYHQLGINKFLGTNFTPEDYIEIYTYLGNRVNHDHTIRFIESGYDMSILPHGRDRSA